jgi:hypothetical protein
VHAHALSAAGAAEARALPGAPNGGEAAAAKAWCRACRAGDGTCPSCFGKGRWGLERIDEGWTLAEVATSLKVSYARAKRLVEVALDHREVREQDKRPRLADARWFIDYELARDPFLTRAEIARRMKPEMCQADFDKTFGYGRRRGRPQRFISVEMGTRLMLALGRDPHELDGC